MNVFPDSSGLNRRDLLARSAYGIGSMALWNLLSQEKGVLAAPQPHFTPRAKNVIFIFMSGGPSHLDLFDPKPKMAALHGQPVPESLTASLADSLIRTSARVMASPRKFQPHGKSGIEFSEFLTKTGEMADEICLIRSMHCEQSNHDPAQLLLNCGTPLFGQPSMGSWVTYGLGSESRDMPGYVVLLSNSGKGVDAGSALWGSGFMPSTYRGVTFRSTGDPVLHLATPRGISPGTQRARLDALRDLNHMHQQRTGDPEIASRIAKYERGEAMLSPAADVFAEARRLTQ